MIRQLRQFLLFLIVLPLGQAVGQDISEGWRLKPGDNPAWADPDFDDSSWNAIEIGKNWESQGRDGLDGFVWYRKRITVPDSVRHAVEKEKVGKLTLDLGKIDDVDQTFWNGSLIGATGNMPKNYGTSWSTTRRYEVPAELVNWEQENVIAVRVYDGANEGGMYEGPYSLRATTWKEQVKLAIDFGDADGILDTPKGMPIRAELTNGSLRRLTGAVRWSIQDDKGESLRSDAEDLVLDAGQQMELSHHAEALPPGFYRVTCSVHDDEGGVVAKESRILGYRPEEIQAPLTRKDDFDHFWTQTLASLRSVDPQIEMKPVPEKTSDTHELFEVSMRSLGGIRVRGWYEKPRQPGPHPAVLRVPGYTQSMYPSGTSDPLAVFSFNIRAHGNSQQDVSGEPANYWIRGLDDKQGYFYQGAYADCVRAVDFLCSREEVDKNRIAVTGASQGGGLSLVTAALDPRISLCSPDIPFLCNWVHYFQATTWPEIDSWIEANPSRSWEGMLGTMSYFDALNFAERISCPVLLGVGLQDGVCPGSTIFAVYNRINSPKRFFVYPEAEHWVGSEHNGRRDSWIKQHFLGSQDEAAK